MFHALRIADRRQETDEAVSLAFAIPEALRGAFAFRPGQYLTLRAVIGGEEIRRAYSICAGVDDGELRVAVKHVPGGAFSGHANAALRVGDMLEVMPPEGRFGHVPAGEGRVYLGLAAGSGITPILSILKSVLAREPGSRFVLLYGSRSTAQVLFRGELEDLKDRYLDRLTVLHTLSREAQDVAALSGRLDGAKLRALLPGLVDAAAVDQAFVCGPEAMLDELPGVLAELGVAAERIQVERFTPSGPLRVVPVAADAPAAAMATIIHEGARREVPVAEGETVLDAALRAGMDLPWSCHGGMCSTCRARVTEGEVEMAVNFSLEPWEVSAGYVLTCQSRVVTPRLVVDYDQV
jgi:ring-1,2-phenylacetyl-CoA epoxidase subunit PaaE